MSPAAVRITAVSALTAMGSGLTEIADGIRAGRCPVRPAAGIGYPGDPPLASAFAPRAWPPGEEAAEAQLLETISQLVATWPAGRVALQSEETALIVGSGGFLYASGAELYWRTQHEGERSAPFRVRGPDWGGELIAGHWQMRGPVLTLSTGCSSAANALLTGVEMLQRGHAQRVLVVGAEGLSAVTLSGFDALMLLAPGGCRPFDRDRTGLQIGEGIAALMLECGTNLPARAALLGGANLCDTHHLTSASPDGRIMHEVMQRALANAAVSTADIVAVKAHGTGSVDSDRAEAHALRALFGDAMPPIAGLKRYVGHTLGACGAVETAAWLACLEAGFVPRTAGFENIDEELDLTPTCAALPARAGCYLLNFFGFGGNYTSLVLAFG